MAEGVYLACAALSIACAIVLFRAYARTSVRFLFWSAVCFLGLSLNNALLFVDLVVAPTIDLSPFRTLAALAGLLLLVYGLIQEAT